MTNKVLKWLSIGVVTGVALVGRSVYKAHAANHTTESFIFNSTPQPAPNGTAPLPLYVLSFQYGTTNYFTNQATTNGLGPVGTNGWIYYQLLSGVYPSPVVGNLTTLTLVNNGYVDPLAWIAQSNIVTSISGGITTNTPSAYTNAVYVQWVAGSTNANGVARPNPLNDVSLFADANGQVTSNLNLVLRFNTDSPTGTNLIYFNFARVNSKFNIVDTNNLWTVSGTNNGTNMVQVITNLSALLNTGCDKLRCYSIGVATNANSTFTGTNEYVQSFALEGWVP
jgi:hypothetical protein